MRKMIIATVVMWLFSFVPAIILLSTNNVSGSESLTEEGSGNEILAEEGSGDEPLTEEGSGSKFRTTWMAVRMPIVLCSVLFVLLVLTLTYRTIMKSIGEAPKRSTGHRVREGNMDVLLETHRKDSRMMKVPGFNFLWRHFKNQECPLPKFSRWIYPISLCFIGTKCVSNRHNETGFVNTRHFKLYFGTK